MSNQFQGVGNLGVAPTLTAVNVAGEARKVANMRLYFDRQIAKGDDGYADKGGFWLSVDMWGFRAEEAIRLLKKGSRVFVQGMLREESWKEETGEERTALRLTVDYFAIDSICVESLQFKEKSHRAAHSE